ncbi:MAG: OadG family protein [Solobacterium sp.]|nr:OadG family protein [Solobacterium sp.]
MLKIIKKILSALAWLLIIAGLVAGGTIYLMNQSALNLALQEPAVQASLRIIIQILLCAAAVFVGLILLSASLKLSGYIRGKEREKEKQEKEKEKQEKEKQKEAEKVQA